MASSTTEIANLALGHLGIGKDIANLDTESSQEAKAMRRYYDICRRTVLQEFTWPFATKFVTLGLVEEDPTDAEEWAFSYRYPADCLLLRRLPSGLRTDNRQSRVAYKISQDASGLLIFTDQEDAQAEYTVDVTNVSRFSDSFVLALTYLLAGKAGSSIMGGDRFKLADRALLLHDAQIRTAHAVARNEEQPDEEPDAEFIRVRDGTTDQTNRDDFTSHPSGFSVS